MPRRLHGRSAWMIPLLLIVALAFLVAAGCGDDDDEAAETAPPAATTTATTATTPTETSPAETTPAETTTGAAQPTVIEIPAAEQGIAFAKTEVTAQAGTLTLRMPNPSPLPHNIAVEEPEQASGEVVNQGGVSEITVDFPAGEYEYFCEVPGHREAGMVGTLTVQ